MVNLVLLNTLQISPDNFSYENILAWHWKLNNENRLVVINFSDNAAQCRIKFELNDTSSEIILEDLLNSVKYYRPVAEIINQGLYIELKSYCSHIFSFKSS